MIDPHRARRPRDCGMRSSLRATYMLHLLALIDVQWRSMSSINVYTQVFYISTLITLPGSSPVGGANSLVELSIRLLLLACFSLGILSLLMLTRRDNFSPHHKFDSLLDFYSSFPPLTGFPRLDTAKESSISKSLTAVRILLSSYSTQLSTGEKSNTTHFFRDNGSPAI